MPNHLFIAAHVQSFRETRSLWFLIAALVLTIRQHRILELLYGAYCTLFHRPSGVHSSEPDAPLISILKEKSALAHYGVRSRERLVQLYGHAFRVDLLPADFQGARGESICLDARQLIIGEYREDSRIACVTADSCFVSEHYRQVPGVRHIHLIEKYGDSGAFLVATGDASKFLDLWSVEGGGIRFVKRLKWRLAGYTAAVLVDGRYYFGSDFSHRPNFIATLGGRRYFFPEKAYNLQVSAFYPYFDRYIVSVNEQLRVLGSKRTLSVFDTISERFIYCEYWPGSGSGEPVLDLSHAHF